MVRIWRTFLVAQTVKRLAYNVGDLGSIPGSGRSSGEVNGNPLQYSCLENPMDRGAWWATVHGVTKSQTRLSDIYKKNIYGKNRPASAGDGLDPWVRKIPWSRKWHPTPVFLPEKFYGQRSWQARVHGVAKSWTWLTTYTYICLYCKVTKYSQPKSWELSFIQQKYLGLQAQERVSQVTLRELLWGGEGRNQVVQFCSKGQVVWTWKDYC